MAPTADFSGQWHVYYEETTQETDNHKRRHEKCAGKPVLARPETTCKQNICPGRWTRPGKGGRPGVVLQPATKREATGQGGGPVTASHPFMCSESGLGMSELGPGYPNASWLLSRWWFPYNSTCIIMFRAVAKVLACFLLTLSTLLAEWAIEMKNSTEEQWSQSRIKLTFLFIGNRGSASISQCSIQSTRMDPQGKKGRTSLLALFLIIAPVYIRKFRTLLAVALNLKSSL